MGLTVRKRINLGGGLRLNLSTKGIGLSAGIPGARYSTRSGWTFSAPGTGLRYRPSRRRR